MPFSRAWPCSAKNLPLKYNPTIIHSNAFNRILPFVLGFLNHSEKKIQLRAVSCLLNFIRSLADHTEEEETPFMTPYYGPMLEKVAQLFNEAQSNFPLLQEVLLLLSQLAEIMKSDFVPYYNGFMPGLKALLSHIPTATP